jgi:DNA-binding SARP family transcriptional activator
MGKGAIPLLAPVLSPYDDLYDDPYPSWPVMICLLGSFRVLKTGDTVPVRSGGKAETLLALLGVNHPLGVLRDVVLDARWPEHDPGLAGQSLNTLVYSLHRLLGDAVDGAPLIVFAEGCYRLNATAGVTVDVAAFDALVREGECAERAGRHARALAIFDRAVALYRGDLCSGSDLRAIVERERLRARYLTLLAKLADDAFRRADYQTCHDRALRLLSFDPFREDAHRMVMRYHVRCGERSQALRQYRLCESLLRSEFDADPEPATRALYDRIRTDPASV